MVQNIIEGDVRRYAVINTTEYNNDGRYAIQVSDYDGLRDLGIQYDDEISIVSDGHFCKVVDMNVGDVATTDYVGAYLMRLA